MSEKSKEQKNLRPSQSLVVDQKRKKETEILSRAQGRIEAPRPISIKQQQGKQKTKAHSQNQNLKKEQAHRSNCPRRQQGSCDKYTLERTYM